MWSRTRRLSGPFVMPVCPNFFLLELIGLPAVLHGESHKRLAPPRNTIELPAVSCVVTHACIRALQCTSFAHACTAVDKHHAFTAIAAARALTLT